MKNKIITISFVTAMFTVGLLGGFACAESFDKVPCDDNQERMEMKHQKHLEIMAEVLDLSEAQKKQIQEIIEQEREIMEGNKEKMHNSREQMRALLENNSFDEVAVRSLAESEAKLKVEAFVAREKVKNQIFQLLTTEQQELAEKLEPLLHEPGKHHRPPMPES
jgi:protein CpxP